jgi:hypothetical protein
MLAISILSLLIPEQDLAEHSDSAEHGRGQDPNHNPTTNPRQPLLNKMHPASQHADPASARG